MNSVPQADCVCTHFECVQPIKAAAKWHVNPTCNPQKVVDKHFSLSTDCIDRTSSVTRMQHQHSGSTVHVISLVLQRTYCTKIWFWVRLQENVSALCVFWSLRSNTEFEKNPSTLEKAGKRGPGLTFPESIFHLCPFKSVCFTPSYLVHGFYYCYHSAINYFLCFQLVNCSLQRHNCNSANQSVAPH